MQHDPLLRAAARVVYEKVYPSDDFDEAERTMSIHYRQAVDAAVEARSVFNAPHGQLALFGDRGLDPPIAYQA